jgi:chemotaxis protein MotB
MRQLISLEGEGATPEMVGSTRWMVSYADLLTVLFVLFIVLYAASPKIKLIEGVPHSPVGASDITKVAQKELQADLLKSLQGMVATGEVALTTREDGLLLEIRDSALFSSGTAKLSSDSSSIIHSLVETLQPRRNHLVIEGHTDNVPIQTVLFPSNWELSAGRAASFVRALQEQGIAPARLAAAGYSDTRPNSSNDTPEGRGQNRRVSVLILNL